MAMIQDALSDGPCLWFVKMCFQPRVGRSTHHSIKKQERDMKNGIGFLYSVTFEK